MYFFLLPFVGLCVAVGMVLLLFRRLRSVAMYILLVPTVYLVLVSILVLAAGLAGKFVGEAVVGWLVLAALILSGPLGIAIGVMLARQINTRLGWSANPND